MPDNECETLFLTSNNTASVRPLRVNTDVHNMHSPSRPTTLGVMEFKSTRTLDSTSQDGNGLQWSAKPADNMELDKLLSHLGNNNSTPVTPTSFLNPRNITEDQEIFADNFSRTLNKLKAEQEGWLRDATATTNDDSSSVVTEGNNTDLVVISESNSSCAIASSASASFGSDSVEYCGSHSPTTAAEENSTIPSTATLGDMRTNTPNRLTDISSPRLTGDPLVQSPNVTRGGFGRSPRTSTIPPSAAPVTCGVLSSEPLYTWSNSQQLITSPDSRTTPDTTPRVTGLPTILSIATSLKEACADRRVSQPSNTDFNGGTNFPGSFQHQTVLSPFSRSTPHPMVSNHSETPVRYAFSDPSPLSLQSTSSCNEGLLASLVAMPSSGASLRPASTDTVPSFEVRGSLGDLYTLVRSEQFAGATSISTSASASLNIVQSSAMTTNALGVLSSSLVGDCSALLNSKTPLTLLVSTNPDYSSGPGSVKDQNRAPTELNSSAAPRLPPGAAMGLVQDMTTGAILFNPDPQLQQLTALYPGLNGSLPNSGLMGGVTSFVLQPSPDANVTSFNFLSALPCTSTGDAALLSAQSLGALRSAGLLQTGLESLTRPLNECDSVQTNAGQQVVVDVSSVPSQMNSTPIPAYYSTTSVPSVQAVSSNPKKVKRLMSSTTSRRNRTGIDPSSLSSGMDSSAIVCADSSTDSFRGTILGAKFGSKRSRSSGNSFGRQPHSQSSNPAASTAYAEGDQLIYVSEPHHTVLVKPEPLSSDFLDSVSNNSESFSIGTGRLLQENTPPSSLESLDQSHLKLERKRARNRVAARRCRERKISLIRSLENQVAERDAQVKHLEEMLARYRSEGERLRIHMEVLSNSYPSLKADLCQFPFLFQHRTPQNTETSKMSTVRSPTPLRVDISEFVSSKHFS